jgi:thiosulfate/3-mercaptopyruvate sulfurtransferase
MLHVLAEPVAVLDGGLAAWPGDLETAISAPALPVHRAAQPWPADRFATADQLASFAGVVLDARTAQRYRDGGPIDGRPGHVPGADSAPWADNLGPDSRFLTPAELQARYRPLGDEPVVAYCGSGVTACHDLLALEIVGGRRTLLYPGSWSQWGADRSRPAETAPARMI